MKKLTALVAFAALFLTQMLSAGSVRLMNDSLYPLRAVIKGHDGTTLGEVSIQPQHAMGWNDAYGHVGYFGKGNAYDEQINRSQTPYTIIWYCSEGGDPYSVCDNIPTGGTVTAESGVGNRICKAQGEQKKNEK